MEFLLRQKIQILKLISFITQEEINLMDKELVVVISQVKVWVWIINIIW